MSLLQNYKPQPLEFNGMQYEYSTLHQAYLEAKKKKQKFLQYASTSIDIDPSRVSQIIVNGKSFDVK